MIIILILSVSFLLQVTAAFYALWLVKVTGKMYSWILISSALFLMGVRRFIPLYHTISSTESYPFDLTMESVGLVLSFLMLLGIMGIRPIFTERKRAEEALRISEEKLRNIIENSSVIIYSVDAQTEEFLYLSPQFEHIFGYSMDDIRSMNGRVAFLSHVIGGDFVPMHSRFSKMKIGDEMPSGMSESWWTTKSGERRYILDSWRAIYKDGKLLYTSGILRDITEQKLAEDELKKYRENLEELVKERTSQLEAANKDLEAFSYSVSHDLRSPLRAIDGFSRILLEEYHTILDDEGKRLLTVVRSNTKRMGQLIDDLLAFSRMGRKEMTRVKIDIEGLARSVVEDLTQSAGERTMEVTVGPLPPAVGDAAMIRQVFVNLLSNAFKFTRNTDRAVVQVEGRIENEENIYSVRDNGAGFDMEYKNKLFGVFQRLHGQDEFEGTGVGLAIVQRIIHRHDGRVWAEGKVNGGACFSFSLPVKPGVEKE